MGPFNADASWANPGGAVIYLGGVGLGLGVGGDVGRNYVVLGWLLSGDDAGDGLGRVWFSDARWHALADPAGLSAGALKLGGAVAGAFSFICSGQCALASARAVAGLARVAPLAADVGDLRTRVAFRARASAHVGLGRYFYSAWGDRSYPRGLSALRRSTVAHARLGPWLDPGAVLFGPIGWHVWYSQ